MKLKRILMLAAVLGLFAIPAAQAQYVIIPTTVNGGTNYVEQGTTATHYSGELLSVANAREVAIMTSFKLTGAGTDNITLKFDSSIDNVNWESDEHTIVVPATGTTTKVAITNITIGAVGFLRLASVQNAAASQDVTNLVVKAAIKPGL